MTSTQRKYTTAEELWLMPQKHSRRELVKGVVREMAPAGGEHGWFTSILNSALLVYVRSHNLGWVFAAETGFFISRDPDTVRAPDCAFISRERAPKLLPKKYVEVIPDLVVEVISPGDSAEDVSEKVNEWLQAGVRLVWVVHPRTRTIMVYRSPREATILHERDTLTGEDVLPGFELPVSEVFE